MGKVRLNDNFSGLQAYKMSNSNGYICSHTRSKGKENPENIDLKSKVEIQVFTNIFKFFEIPAYCWSHSHVQFVMMT